MRHLRTFRSSKTFRALLLFFSGTGILYLLLFSPWGNRLLSGIVEQGVSRAVETPVTVREFSLTHNRFDLLFDDERGNVISTQGGFSLLTLRLYAHYRIDYPKAGGINTLGVPLKTEGSLNGGISAFDIHGNAKALGGDVLYRIQLHRFKLASLYLVLNRISYEGLLRLFDYPSSTDTVLEGTVDLKGFDTRFVEGFVRLSTQTDRFTPTEILSDEESEPFSLHSLLSDKYGQVRAFDVNVVLEASMEHAGVLEQFVGMHLAGPADLKIILTGDKKLLALNGRSSIARSDTSFSALIQNLEPKRLAIDVAHADVAEIFTLFALPSPLTGTADINGNFGIESGKLDVRLNRASTLPEVLKREYNITQPPILFNADLTADLSKTGVRYRGSFVSDLKRLEFADSAAHDQMLRELLKTFR